MRIHGVEKSRPLFIYSTQLITNQNENNNNKKLEISIIPKFLICLDVIVPYIPQRFVLKIVDKRRLLLIYQKISNKSGLCDHVESL